MEIYDEAYLRQKLEWVKYRLWVLDEIEARLVHMRKIAVSASCCGLDVPRRQELNGRLRVLENEVNEMNDKSKTFWLDCQ